MKDNLYRFATSPLQSSKISHYSLSSPVDQTFTYHALVLTSSIDWTPSAACHLWFFVYFRSFGIADHSSVSPNLVSQKGHYLTSCVFYQSQFDHMRELCNHCHTRNFRHILSDTWIHFFVRMFGLERDRILIPYCISFRLAESLALTINGSISYKVSYLLICHDYSFMFNFILNERSNPHDHFYSRLYLVSCSPSSVSK